MDLLDHQLGVLQLVRELVDATYGAFADGAPLVSLTSHGDHGLQGVMGRIGHIADRVLHLDHGGSDTSSFQPLLLELVVGGLQGRQVALGDGAELIGALHHLTQHGAHLLGQPVDPGGQSAKFVLAAVGDLLGHVALTQGIENLECLAHRRADGVDDSPQHDTRQQQGDQQTDEQHGFELNQYLLGLLNPGLQLLVDGGVNVGEHAKHRVDDAAGLLALIAQLAALFGELQMLGEQTLVTRGGLDQLIQCLAERGFKIDAAAEGALLLEQFASQLLALGLHFFNQLTVGIQTLADLPGIVLFEGFEGRIDQQLQVVSQVVTQPHRVVGSQRGNQ